jgi:PST family polysaccharide transporter
MEDVGVRAATAARWSMATQAGQVLLQLGVQVALARLLGPETYGVFAIGLIVLTFTSFVSDFGFAWGLIQR